MVEPVGERMLSDLPQLGASESFTFGCHPGVSCFNACCADLELLLSPYDAWRLRRALGLEGGVFLERFTRCERDPGSGFPLVFLSMAQRRGQPCPFVEPAGCSVYADRPSACRAYPLGRGTRVGPNDEVLETFVLVQEPHCLGFTESGRSTPLTYMAAQGLADYNRHNDAFMRLLAGWQDTGRVLGSAEAALVLTALYRPEQLGAELRSIGESKAATAAVATLVAGDEASLSASLAWLSERFGL